MRAVLHRLRELSASRQTYVASDGSRLPDGAARISPWQRLFELQPGLRQLARAGAGAGAISTLLHLTLLVVAAQLTIAGYPQQVVLQIQSLFDNEPLPPEPAESIPLRMAEASDEPSESVFEAEPIAIAAIESDDPQVNTPLEVDDLDAPSIALADEQHIEALEADPVMIRAGGAGEEIATVEGAVDRITHEIMTNLEQGDLLVCWLMDASISLVDERQIIAERLTRVFDEIETLGTLRPEALLNAVTSFGAETRFLVPPTHESARVVQAIRDLPVDESGVENVFSAIVDSLEQYRALKGREKRHLMVVIWTDESGDDYARLEESIRMCQRLAVPVFTVGPSSMFGNEKGTHAYQHPQDGRTYPIEVDRGPDSLRYELLRIPYWFDGDQFEQLHAGVGPYALTRLAIETGGAYFISEPKADRSPFSLEAMRPYLPDYSAPNEYLRHIHESPLREAVLHAVDVTHHQKLKGTPRLEFEPTGENFQQQLLDAQRSVAFNLVTIEAALVPFGTKGLERYYEQEASPRWRAWYDLTYGRLLAMEVRANEYNWVCAEMKGKGADFVDKQSNRWRFKPSTTIRFGSAAQRQAAEATRLLTRCVEQNRGTPWEQLANRELKDPLGFEIEEGYVPPPARPQMVAGNNQPPMGIRSEELRKLPRPEKPQLPKL
ncbi:MAG: VWA domain-containing protein [Pirellulales bacterium]|nr:VWA domain-containing protein [Pirellulales bacterium]